MWISIARQCPLTSRFKEKGELKWWQMHTVLHQDFFDGGDGISGTGGWQETPAQVEMNTDMHQGCTLVLSEVCALSAFQTNDQLQLGSSEFES